jgi:hypothetical protein
MLCLLLTNMGSSSWERSIRVLILRHLSSFKPFFFYFFLPTWKNILSFSHRVSFSLRTFSSSSGPRQPATLSPRAEAGGADIHPVLRVTRMKRDRMREVGDLPRARERDTALVGVNWRILLMVSVEGVEKNKEGNCDFFHENGIW